MKNALLFATVLLFSACSTVNSVDEPTASDSITSVRVVLDTVVPVVVDTTVVDTVVEVK